MSNPTVSSEIENMRQILIRYQDVMFEARTSFRSGGDSLPYFENCAKAEEEALSKLEELMKNIAWVIYDISDTPHLVIGTSAVNTHDPKLCPECIEPGVLKALSSSERR